MFSAFRNILKINLSTWIFLLFMVLLCNFKDLEARPDKKEQTEIDGNSKIGVELSNEVLQLKDDALEGCETAGCSHSCLKSAGKAFCVCPDGMELGEDWKTCHESYEEVEEDSEDEVEENGEEDDENVTENDGSEEYEDYEDDKNEVKEQNEKEVEGKESQIESNKVEDDTDKDIKEENEERHSEQDKIVDNEENGNSEEDVEDFSKGGENGDKIFKSDGLENDIKEENGNSEEEVDDFNFNKEVGNGDKFENDIKEENGNSEEEVDDFNKEVGNGDKFESDGLENDIKEENGNSEEDAEDFSKGGGNGEKIFESDGPENDIKEENGNSEEDVDDFSKEGGNGDKFESDGLENDIKEENGNSEEEVDDFNFNKEVGNGDKFENDGLENDIKEENGNSEEDGEDFSKGGGNGDKLFESDGLENVIKEENGNSEEDVDDFSKEGGNGDKFESDGLENDIKEENGNSEEDVEDFSKGGGNGDKIFESDGLENAIKEENDQEVQKEFDKEDIHEESSEIGDIADQNKSNNETEHEETIFDGENVAEEVEKILNTNNEVKGSNMNALNAEHTEDEDKNDETEEDYDENEEEIVEDHKNQIKVTTEIRKLEDLENHQVDGRRNIEIGTTSKTNEESTLVLVVSSTDENDPMQRTTENYNQTSLKSDEEEEYGEEYDEDDYYDNEIKHNATTTDLNVDNEENVTKSADELTKIDDQEAEISGDSKIVVSENNRIEEIRNNNIFSSSEAKHNKDMEENNSTNEFAKDNKQTEDDYEEYEEESAKNEIIPNTTNNIFDLTTIETMILPKSCEIGFEKQAKDGICIDINECANEELNVCEQNCINTIGHFYCTCDAGYELSLEDNSSCLDMDECNQNICSHYCVNTLGGFNCTCPANYYLKDNQRECVEINCTHGYDFNQTKNELKCVCLDSSYSLLEDGVTCQEISKFCQVGFVYNADLKLCEDINECLNANCAQICVNIIGSYECDCKIGFQLQMNDISCEDIDECSLGTHQCQHDCFNNVGSYNCACWKGFALSADQKHCQDVDECHYNNGHCSDDCENLMGSFKCNCPTNFELATDEMTCIEVDLCLIDNGGCSNGCLSTQGQVLCSCPKGFELDQDKLCKKRNPCQRNNGGCSHFCEINNDFVQCKCPESYELHNSTHCNQINPCFESNNGCSHICDDKTAICKCPDDSFELIDKTCYKINPCAINNGGCSHKCQFLDEENVHCSCPKNHELIDDNKSCVEINPCHESNGHCSHECIFKDGVKLCLCPQGLDLQENQLDCVCREDNGGCKCPRRFELVNRTCVRINPCLINNGGCSHNCTFRSRVKCSCPSTNYILHGGKICLRLENDVCQRDLNGGCSHICSQEYGRKICKCPLGFVLKKPDGLQCKDVNECKIGNGGCSHGCINSPGSYNCTCPKGLHIDDSKLNCQDVDECLLNNSYCEQTCTNYHGGFRCSCRKGFILDKDGRRCNPGGFFECPNFTLSKTEGGNVKCLGASVEGHRYVPSGTKCVVWCDKGYKINGDAILMCQNNGNWSSTSPSCIRTTCPKVPNPNSGRLIPSSCTSAQKFVGDKCRIYCRRGFRNVPNYEYIQCQDNLLWTTISATKTKVSLAQIQAACIQADIPKPFILCPEQGMLTFELPTGRNEMLVHIPRPKSNVDWWKYIHAEPSWAKSLSATLPPGRVEVKYTAYSPVTNDTSASCHLVIEVKDAEAPTVTDCPEDIVVQLQPGEGQRKVVYWREPEVRDNVGVRTLYKSKDSGSQFGIGKHYINYVVSDDGGNRAYCHFNVIVKGAYDDSSSNKYRAVLICPDGIHMMAETDDSIDRNIQVNGGCYWKHVRVTSSLKMTTTRPVNYFQRQYPDPYQFSHGNYPFSSKQRVQNYRDYQLHNTNSYKPFSWYNRCC